MPGTPAFSRLSLSFFVIVLLGACTDTPTQPVPNIASVAVDPAGPLQIEAGDTLRLTAVARDATGNLVEGASFSWDSSDPEMGEVSAAGLVTGLRPGELIITAREGSSGTSAEVIVRVIAATIELSHEQIAMPVGGLHPLSAWVRDAAGEEIGGMEVEWTSSDQAVASVGPNGTVEAHAVGSVTITASSAGAQDAVLVEVEEMGVMEQGTGYSCALSSSGTAYCWGINDYGQLGKGTFGEHGNPAEADLRPAPVAGDLRFRLISAGPSHVIALTHEGAAYTWGLNRHGSLGTGDTDDRNAPVRVAEGLSFVTASAGTAHTVALTADGTAWAWGNVNEWAPYGVGNGSTEGTLLPVQVAGGHSFAFVTAGMYATVALTADGVAYAWGNNGQGKLGDGEGETRLVPHPVAGGHRFVSVSHGGNHAIALTADGTAYSWGYNGYGQLGNGEWDEEVNATPMPVAGGIGFVMVSAGVNFSLGLTADGQVYAWGANHSGQLGNGELSGQSSDPETFSLEPSLVIGGLTFRSVAAGGVHAIALTRDGRAFGWGHNGLGSVGDGTRTDHTSPVPVDTDVTFR